MTARGAARRVTSVDLLAGDEVASVEPRDIDALVRECLPLVKHHVRSIAARIPAHVDRDELMSAGMYALATCAHRYDPSVGTSFAQFASPRIRGALVDELRDIDWASRSVRKRSRDAGTVADQLAHELGRTATETEIADAMGITGKALSAIRADAHRGQVVSLQAALPADADVLAADGAEPDAALLQREELAMLGGALAKLPERLRTVVEQYFFGQRKMSDIAAELGVTESRVSQLRSQALLRLREMLNETDADDSSAADAAPTTRAAGAPRARTLVAVGGSLVAKIPPAKPLAAHRAGGELLAAR
jgi:RNA polymerase sigma factor for flagellar operon FliA